VFDLLHLVLYDRGACRSDESALAPQSPDRNVDLWILPVSSICTRRRSIRFARDDAHHPARGCPSIGDRRSMLRSIEPPATSSPLLSPARDRLREGRLRDATIPIAFA
jgi:hypothetical protein